MKTTLSYYITFILLGMVTASLGPTLPGLAEQTQTQLGEISFLFMTRAIGYLVGSFFGGRLYDRLTGHRLMSIALLTMAAGMALVPFIPLVALLAGVLLVVGLGEGLLDVGGNTLIVWHHGEKVGPYMNALHFFFGVGTVLAPLILAQMILIADGITGTYLLIAFLLLPMALWLNRVPSPSIQSGEDEDGARPFDRRLVSLIFVFLALYVGMEVGFGGWIFTYGIEVGLVEELTAAYLTAAFWIAFTTGRLAGIPLAARVRPRWLLSMSLVGALAGLLSMGFWPGSLIVLWGGTLLYGASIATIFPTMLNLAGRRMRITGRLTGIFFLGATTGGIFIPWLIGQGFEGLGPGFLLQFLIGILVLDLVALTAILRIRTPDGLRPD
jgi:FHS family Na+ dependent glucose MFS transporter 1